MTRDAVPYVSELAAMDLAKLAELHDDQREILYKEYSAWSRHHHLLVWTTAAFGVTIPISTIFLYKDLRPLPYTVIALGALAVLLATHMIAAGNRRQWADYKSVPNRIELLWKLRDETNLDRALNTLSPATPSVKTWRYKLKAIFVVPRVETWRNTLYVIFAVILLLTVCVKWYEATAFPEPSAPTVDSKQPAPMRHTQTR